ncbi:MAG: DUF2281 domain-containing protein [Bacteroidota bacterium]
MLSNIVKKFIYIRIRTYSYTGKCSVSYWLEIGKRRLNYSKIKNVLLPAVGTLLPSLSRIIKLHGKFFSQNTTVADIKSLLHEKIERLSDNQLKNLYALFEEKFPEKKQTNKRLLGRMPGLIKYMAEDFDEPMDHFKDYMPE